MSLLEVFQDKDSTAEGGEVVSPFPGQHRGVQQPPHVVCFNLRWHQPTVDQYVD